MTIPVAPDCVDAIKTFVEALTIPWSPARQDLMLERFNYNFREYALPGPHQGKMLDPDTNEWVAVTPKHFCNLMLKKHIEGMLRAGEKMLRHDGAEALIEEWDLDI